MLKWNQGKKLVAFCPLELKSIWHKKEGWVKHYTQQHVFIYAILLIRFALAEVVVLPLLSPPIAEPYFYHLCCSTGNFPNSDLI